MTPLEEFLYELRERWDELPVAGNTLKGGTWIDPSERDPTAHPCQRCGQSAHVAVTAESPLLHQTGFRFVDLCYACYGWIKEESDVFLQ